MPALNAVKSSFTKLTPDRVCMSFTVMYTLEVDQIQTNTIHDFNCLMLMWSWSTLNTKVNDRSANGCCCKRLEQETRKLTSRQSLTDTGINFSQSAPACKHSTSSVAVQVPIQCKQFKAPCACSFLNNCAVPSVVSNTQHAVYFACLTTCF